MSLQFSKMGPGHVSTLDGEVFDAAAQLLSGLSTTQYDYIWGLAILFGILFCCQYEVGELCLIC